MTGFEWVVAILAATLAILLILMIVLAFYLIKLVKNLRSISEKAEKVADNVETASSFFRQSAGTVVISKFIANIVEAVKSSSETKKGKKK